MIGPDTAAAAIAMFYVKVRFLVARDDENSDDDDGCSNSPQLFFRLINFLIHPPTLRTETWGTSVALLSGTVHQFITPTERSLSSNKM